MVHGACTLPTLPTLPTLCLALPYIVPGYIFPAGIWSAHLLARSGKGGGRGAPSL